MSWKWELLSADRREKDPRGRYTLYLMTLEPGFFTRPRGLDFDIPSGSGGEVSVRILLEMRWRSS